jgi:FMN phosphatase YigB (HAD superfamily)
MITNNPFKNIPSTLSKMNILLDFDGVILQNKKLEQIITKRSVDYVYSKSNTCYTYAANYNRKMYKKLGHTALIFNNSANYHHEVCEYNEKVFHELDFDKDIKPFINNEDVLHVSEILNSFEGNNKPGLFTNTPLIWVYETLGMLGFEIDNVFNTDMMFTSDEGFVKPKMDAYSKVNSFLEKQQIVFIDDNEKNILPIDAQENWIGFYVPKNRKDMLYDYVYLLANMEKYISK